jgi:hypothetical protein
MRRLLTVVTGVGLCAFAFAAHAEARTSSSGANDIWYQFGSDRSETGRTKSAARARTSRRTGSTNTRRHTRRQTARSTRGTRTRSASFLRRGAASASRTCLTSAARALLGRIEARFGRVQVISTCRPGARIAGTGRISRHASGNAVDFKVNGKKAQVVRWLIANHRSGGTMTYAGMSHVHVDIGPRFVALNHGARRRFASR